MTTETTSAFVKDEVYRITCSGYIVNPMALSKDGVLYFVGFRTYEYGGESGDLIYRKVRDVDQLFRPASVDYISDYFDLYVSPWTYHKPVPDFGIIATGVADPWYLVDGTIVYFTYAKGGNVYVGKYDFASGDLAAALAMPAAGEYPVIIKHPETGSLYLFYKVGTALWFMVNADGEHWSVGHKITDLDIANIDFDLQDVRVMCAYELAAVVYFMVWELHFEARYHFHAPIRRRRFATKRAY